MRMQMSVPCQEQKRSYSIFEHGKLYQNMEFIILLFDLGTHMSSALTFNLFLKRKNALILYQMFFFF